MFARLVVSGVLACGLLLAPLAGGAEAAARGALKGRTAQGYRITLRTQGENALRLLRFKADLKCRDGGELLLEESGFLPTPLRRDGSFKDTQYGATDTVRFKGRVTDGAVRGRVRLEERLGKKRVRCSSRWIPFRARR